MAKNPNNAAGRCYDCGKEHPDWFEDFLDQMWSDDEVPSDELVERAEAFSEAEHPNCFK